MEGTARTWFTPKQKAELWERWRSGQCVADIARTLELKESLKWKKPRDRSRGF
jgi:hypothetical protein